VLESGLRAARDLIDGFDVIAMLFDYSDGEFALEVPKVP